MKTHHCNIASTRTTTSARLNFGVRFLTRTMRAFTAALLVGLSTLSFTESSAVAQQADQKPQPVTPIPLSQLPKELKSIGDQLDALEKSKATSEDKFKAFEKIRQQLAKIQRTNLDIMIAASRTKNIMNGILAPFIEKYADSTNKAKFAQIQKNWKVRDDVFMKGVPALGQSEGRVQAALNQEVDIYGAIQVMRVYYKNMITFQSAVDWTLQDGSALRDLVTKEVKNVRQKATELPDKKKAQTMLDDAQKVEEKYINRGRVS